jgi:hypothetical protein
MKRYFFIVVVVLTAGCGSNPMTPSATITTPAVSRPLVLPETTPPFDCSSIRWFAAGCGCQDNRIVCVDPGPLELGPIAKD